MSDRAVIQVAADIPGSEGPLVTADGRIFVVAPRVGEVREILPDGRQRVVVRTGGIPAGLQLHRDGSIWIADMKRGILRLGGDGGVTEEVTAWQGRPVPGCNDCSFDGDGHLYFTAPEGSSADRPIGQVFCRLASGRVVRLDGGFAFCNGIAVTEDNRTVIVAETFTKRLWGYRLSGPGEVAEKFLFGTLPGAHRGGPDGIEFDARGRLLATNFGAGTLEVFRPCGRWESAIPLPFENPSNLHFAGPGSRGLLITEHTACGLWRTEWECAGLLQYGWRT